MKTTRSKAINLTFINLSSNHLQGLITLSLASLDRTSYLGMLGNYLMGNIDEIFFIKWTNFVSLQLQHNKISGAIPSEVGMSQRFELLFLYHNSFQGFIPPEIGNFSNLQHLDVSSNSLNGKIPTELGNLTSLTMLNLFLNSFMGRILVELRKLK